MADRKSTARKKHEAVAKLKSWIAEKIRTNTLDSYIRRGKLNRSEIALECGFVRSSFSSNDLLAAELRIIEEELIEGGVIAEPSSAGEKQSTSSALESRLAGKEREIKSLRERLAIKSAECEELKRKLSSSNSILDEIIPTGKRLQL